jgi:Tfp pilus assembly PilM family ATPase
MALIARSLPLGIDIGTTRIRIAETARDEDGILLKSVSVIDLEEKTEVPHDEQYLGARIAQTLRELNIRERRCIAAAGDPDSVLRTVSFPPMRPRERERAGTFEAMRYIDYPIEEAVVRTLPIDPGKSLYALGIMRRARMDRILRILRIAGLRASAIDHEACALQRAFPYADAVLDTGLAVSRLYAFNGKQAPLGILLDGGSHIFTQAIAQGLSVDLPTAEKRKRAIGLSGAGEGEMSAYAASVGRAFLTARNQGMPEIHRLILTGNGARLAGLADRIERDTGCSADVASHLGVERTDYQRDITRASAPDWALSVGLSLWSAEDQAA